MFVLVEDVCGLFYEMVRSKSRGSITLYIRIELHDSQNSKMRTLYHKTHHLMMLPEQQHGRMHAAKQMKPSGCQKCGWDSYVENPDDSHGESCLQNHSKKLLNAINAALSQSDSVTYLRSPRYS